MEKYERFEKNAPGDFYVVKDQCLACCVAQAQAPKLIGLDEKDLSCYFKRQPQNDKETKAAIEAINCSCCAALRYGGNDVAILQKLKEKGLEAWCDSL